MKNDLAKFILREQKALDSDHCQYPEEHYNCYMQAFERIVEAAQTVLKKKRKRKHTQ